MCRYLYLDRYINYKFRHESKRTKYRWEQVKSLLQPISRHESGQPVAEVQAHLHVQISPKSCNVVGSILRVLGKNTDTTILGYRWTGGGRASRPVLLTGAKKSGVPD